MGGSHQGPRPDGLRSVSWLSVLVAVLVVAATLFGLFGAQGGGPYTFTSLRGETVEVFGQGPYRYDSLLVGAGNRGVDLVTLALGVPLLLLFTHLYRRGSSRGALLLAGIHGYLGYVYAGRALGAAYNDLFLIYVAAFSASLFATVSLLSSLMAQGGLFIPGRLPRRLAGAVMLTTAILTFGLWLEAPITAMLSSTAPATMDHYTTLVTHAMDLAVVVPTLALSGMMVLRRRTNGYLIAFPFLFLVAMLAPALTAMTLAQLAAGVALTVSQIVAYVVGFVLLGLAAAWAIWRIVIAVREDADLG